jgi:hypothetical protein
VAVQLVEVAAPSELSGDGVGLLCDVCGVAEVAARIDGIIGDVGVGIARRHS